MRCNVSFKLGSQGKHKIEEKKTKKHSQCVLYTKRTIPNGRSNRINAIRLCYKNNRNHDFFVVIAERQFIVHLIDFILLYSVVMCIFHVYCFAQVADQLRFNQTQKKNKKIPRRNKAI